MRRLRARIEAVTDPRLRQDVTWCCVRFDLLPQVPNKHSQVFVLFYVVVAPDGGEQCAVREDLSRVFDQVNQQIKFFWCQVDFVPTYFNLARFEVNVKISNVERDLCALIEGWRVRATK